MKEAKVKFVMAGVCEKCGKKFRRKPPTDAVACTCTNPEPTLVLLHPTLILPSSLYKRYNRIAQLAEVDVELLINQFLAESMKQKLKELKALPEIIVTTRLGGIT
jgi:hypothetical protein